MKIAVVGCGALGSFYGAKLARAGQDLHFLLRSDYDTVRQHGVRIRSLGPGDGFRAEPAVIDDFVVRPFCAQRPEEIGPADLVLIGLKTTANASFKRLLPCLVGAQTTVLTLQNGLGNEEQLADLFPATRIMGGLCFVCLNRVAPGVILHIAHGKVIVGEHKATAGERTEAVARLFRESGIVCEVTDNLTRTHWEKLVWNVPFNGLGVAGCAGYEAVQEGAVRNGARLGPCLTTDLLLDRGRWEALVRELMLEVIATANGLGLGLRAGVADVQIERTRSMGAYKASTLIDFERGQPLELESLFVEPLKRAQRVGTVTFRLASLCSVLQAIEGKRPGAENTC
jgi:2-dehydropantoate 2-reductase